MPVEKPTEIEQSELDLSSLETVLAGDEAYFGEGPADPGDDVFENMVAFLYWLSEPEGAVKMGEMAETPIKVESKTTRLKTRTLTLAGKRNTVIEIAINGMSLKQKDYFEGRFANSVISILICPKGIAEMDPEEDSAKLLVFSGCGWTVDWSGEVDGLWSVVISTEFSGSTGRIFWVEIPVFVDEEE